MNSGNMNLKKEYEENKKQIEHLKNGFDLLNERGVAKYYELVNRNETIKEKLETEPIYVAVDFDGVLNKYEGWKGENDLSVPQSGVKYFLKKLNENYEVIIFTVRDTDKVKNWLEKHELSKYVIHVTDMKPKAVAYIDDRAINYDGNYEKVLNNLKDFKTWWEK